MDCADWWYWFVLVFSRCHSDQTCSDISNDRLGLKHDHPHWDPPHMDKKHTRNRVSPKTLTGRLKHGPHEQNKRSDSITVAGSPGFWPFWHLPNFQMTSRSLDLRLNKSSVHPTKGSSENNFFLWTLHSACTVNSLRNWRNSSATKRVGGHLLKNLEAEH